MTACLDFREIPGQVPVEENSFETARQENDSPLSIKTEISGKLEEQTDQDQGLRENVKFFILCLVIILVVFGLLGVVIYYVGKSNSLLKESKPCMLLKIYTF